MPAFKKIIGDYCKVLKQLETPEAFYAPQSIESYYQQILIDLPRTCFASDAYTVEQIKTSLLQTEHLITARKPFVYTQGDFFGEIFTLMGTKQFMLNHHGKQFGEIIAKTPNPVPNIHFAYIDEEGINCALGVSYLIRMDEKRNIIAENYPFLVHIKNTNAPLQDRKITCIAHPFFLEKELNVELINEQDLPGTLYELINHKKIGSLFKNMFEGDSLSVSKFNDLEKRFKVNFNIDHSDIKRTQLADLSNFITSTFSDNAVLMQYWQELLQQAQHIDFFKQEAYETMLKAFSEKIEEHLLQQQHSQNLLIATKITFDAYKLELQAYNLTKSTKKEIHFFRELLALKRVLLKKRNELLQNLNQNHQMVSFEELLAKAKEKTKLIPNQELQSTIERLLLGREANRELVDFVEAIEEKSITDADFFDFQHIRAVTQLSKKEKVLLQEEREFEKNLVLTYADKLEILAKKLKLQKLISIAALEFPTQKMTSLNDLSTKNEQFYLTENFNNLYNKCLIELNQLILSASKKIIKAETPDYLQQALLAKAEEMRALLTNQGQPRVYSETIKIYRHIDFFTLAAYTLQKAFVDNRVLHYQARLKAIQKKPDYLTTIFITKAANIAEMDNKEQIKKLIFQELQERHSQLQKAINDQKVALETKAFLPKNAFWQRNATNIVKAIFSFTVFVLSLVVLLLIFSGVLAPLGITLLGTAVTGTGIALTVFGGSAALISSINTILSSSAIFQEERQNKEISDKLFAEKIQRLEDDGRNQKDIICTAEVRLATEEIPAEIKILEEMHSEFGTNFNQIMQNVENINPLNNETNFNPENVPECLKNSLTEVRLLVNKAEQIIPSMPSENNARAPLASEPSPKKLSADEYQTVLSLE